MIYVGIDIAKDKHDCVVCSPDGKILIEAFTVSNTLEGFNELLKNVYSACKTKEEIRVGLEATGHYCFNILEFLIEHNLTTYVINPLHTNMYRKSLTLRKTKTDKVDAHTIAMMLMSEVNLTPYSKTHHNYEELKSLTRYRFDKVAERARLKTSVSRLVNILFPEIEKLVPTLHIKSVYQLLKRYPSASHVAKAPVSDLESLLYEASKGHYNRETAERFKKAATESIGSVFPAKSLELKHTINLVQELNGEIDEIEKEINSIMDEISSPILSIPGINYNMGAMIIAEIGDFNRFLSADKILAYAGLSPSTYQSGKLQNGYSHMEKRGSRYLRYALFTATKFVCRWEPEFCDYLKKKRGEGKHYHVAISHAAKKLVRLIYHLETSGEKYICNNKLKQNDCLNRNIC